MKFKISKSQWEEMGKKAGWNKKAQSEITDPRKELSDMIQKIYIIHDEFDFISANLPKESWQLIEKDCDEVRQHLNDAAGRISTVIHRVYNMSLPAIEPYMLKPSTKE